jgi:hypothetical protein
VGESVAFGAKPSTPDHNVVAMSNGYPSGPHFNLNIHGKKPGFACPEPDPLDGYGSSVFIPEFQSDYPDGPATVLEYVASKKFDVAALEVLDACTAQFDGDAARIQLPKTGIYSDGYWVFGRARAKPDNSVKPGDPSNIILTPDPVLRICDDGTVDFDGDGVVDDCPAPDSDLWPLGLVTSKGVYKLGSAGLERFEPSSKKGKGHATAQDLTGLMTWTGYVCPASLDVSGPDSVPDGVIDEWDVPNDLDGDLDIDADDLAIYLTATCDFHDSEWVLNVADLVVQDQDVVNDGVKLLKLRFYPVQTTEFTPTVPKIVASIHDSAEADVTGAVVSVLESVHGAAVLSAGTGPVPQGTVDFSFYDNGTCSGAAVLNDTLDVDPLGVAHPTADLGPLDPGVYSLRAHYAGDDPNGYYEPSDSACVAVTVSEVPVVAIEIRDGTGAVVTTPVVAGTAVHPSAFVSGSGATPTGTVTFRWYTNGTCTPLDAGTYDTTLVLGEADAVSFAQTPAAETYSFNAFYNGDANYVPTWSPCATLTVVIAP